MTNAEARFNKSLRPRKPEGSLGRTAQDVHLDSHTAPELCFDQVQEAALEFFCSVLRLDVTTASVTYTTPLFSEAPSKSNSSFAGSEPVASRSGFTRTGQGDGFKRSQLLFSAHDSSKETRSGGLSFIRKVGADSMSSHTIVLPSCH